MERNSNNGKNSHWSKIYSEAVDAEYEVISSVDEEVTTLRPLKPMHWKRSVELAAYNTIYTIDNYTPPGIMVDKLV